MLLSFISFGWVTEYTVVCVSCTAVWLLFSFTSCFCRLLGCCRWYLHSVLFVCGPKMCWCDLWHFNPCIYHLPCVPLRGRVERVGFSSLFQLGLFSGFSLFLPNCCSSFYYLESWLSFGFLSFLCFIFSINVHTYWESLERTFSSSLLLVFL